ncbi:MAG: tRNA 2-thiouridine(34) synthase MnmA [Clostridia bacterium]|nr:tRNA 2-thiouridine(34) synthase MnmA [Clostridia bacterium]
MVGMSGGVDSSVTAALLLRMGYSVAGVTLLLCGEDDDRNVADAAAVCRRLGIPHFVFDLKKEFSDFVMTDFTEQYINGNTPNPCIECNKHIKFGAMLRLARENGYVKIATGHYARISRDENGRYILSKAADISKDQSYVLYNLTQTQLESVLFPLGELTKQQVREIAEEMQFVNADRPDSQDICFVPDGDYASFIERYSDFSSAQGNYLDLSGNVLGEHKGIIHYTIGQRKGLGIALGKPAFVIDKCSKTNTVVLGDEQYLFKRNVVVDRINFIPFDLLTDGMQVTVKLRYRHSAQPALISCLDGDRVLIEFEEPQRAPSPGQAAVFYDGDTVIGGGRITDSY